MQGTLITCLQKKTFMMIKKMFKFTSNSTGMNFTKTHQSVMWRKIDLEKFYFFLGNLNAHHVAYPKKDWVVFANDFVNNGLGLDRSQTTTQIEHYDNLAALVKLITCFHDSWIWIYHFFSTTNY